MRTYSIITTAFVIFIFGWITVMKPYSGLINPVCFVLMIPVFIYIIKSKKGEKQNDNKH